MVKFSIVIPTYGNRCEDLLKPCLNSIKEYTNLDEVEILIVANGCIDHTAEFVTQLGNPFKLIWESKAIGYTKACNIGMRQAQGEFIVLLNNDTQLLSQPKNEWLEILVQPFLIEEKMSVTGPMKQWCPYAEHDFLIGFCTMFRKSILDKIGLYDEIFEAYGEDCEICVRAVKAGYKIAQVPDETIRRLSENPNIGTGNFRLWHKGNESYKNWPGGEELLRKNREILKERFGINIKNAQKLDGWIADDELKWLAQQARKSKIVLEIGAWHGKSSRAIADNLPKDSILYCIDTWAGSLVEQATHHQSAKLMDGDHAFDEFCRGMWNLIESGKVIPLRMHSKHAAKLLWNKKIKVDFIFIDGDHTYEGVKEDILNYLPLLKEGGIISGHDAFHQANTWPGVLQAVREIFGWNVGNSSDTSIWFTDFNPLKQKIEVIEKPKIYDCFIFNSELDLLELRFKTLFTTVDKFVLVEASSTHQRQLKPLYFKENLNKFEKYLSKVIHIICEFPSELNPNMGNNQEAGEDYWKLERYQRDKIMDGLTECKDTDVIIISDLDELPSPEAIKNYKSEDRIKALEMGLYYYNMNCKAEGKWCEAKILNYAELKNLGGPCNARYTQAERIPNGGNHCSYFGSVEAIINKINNTAHREYNTDYFKNPERIKKCVENCIDIFERPNEKFIKV